MSASAPLRFFPAATRRTRAASTRSKAGTRVRRTIAASFGALVLCAAGVAAFMLWPRHASDAECFRTMVIARGDVVHHVAAIGRVEPRSTTAVGAAVSGRVTEVLVDVGDRVVGGQLLARVDVPGTAAHLDRLQVAVDSAAAAARRRSAELERARLTDERVRARFARERASGAQLDAAHARLAVAETRRTTALRQLALRESELADARAAVADTGIHAPTDGLVLACRVERGASVAAADGLVPFLLATDLDRMRVVAPIDAVEVGNVAVGQRARFVADGLPKQTFHAEVVELRDTGEAVLTVENGGRALRPGMTGTVGIETVAVHDAWRVLDAALAFRPPGEKRRDGAAVWVLTAKGPRRRPVVVGIGDGTMSAVEGDLRDGDMVILELTDAGREAYGTHR